MKTEIEVAKGKVKEAYENYRNYPISGSKEGYEEVCKELREAIRNCQKLEASA